jgi:hypothetical protein
MSSNYSQVRKLVIDYIKEHVESDFNTGVIDELKKLGRSKEISVTNELLKQIFHDLYLDRIIITGGKVSDSKFEELNWPHFCLTEYGQQIITKTDYYPYDPEEYEVYLKKEIPLVDETIIIYLKEALSCYNQNHLLSSAVMLGCAAEKAMLLLIESYGNSIADLTIKAIYEKNTGPNKSINQKFKEFNSRFKNEISNLPYDLKERIDIKIEHIFNLIRETRNAAGHPTGVKIDRETIYANMILFRVYCKAIYELFAHFDRKNDPTTP